MPGLHGCMTWEAELGPITRDEKKVIVGCSLEKSSAVCMCERERCYQHSHLIMRPHYESKTPRPGRILKLQEICWHGRRSCSQHQKKPNIQTNALGRFKLVLVGLTSNDLGLLYKAIKGITEVRNQLHLMSCSLPELVHYRQERLQACIKILKMIWTESKNIENESMHTVIYSQIVRINPPILLIHPKGISYSFMHRYSSQHGKCMRHYMEFTWS